jgi:hypothetical protein
MVNMENLQVTDNVIITSPKKGRGQYERKARGSYQNEKKITVVLFLNKKLKPVEVDNKKNYPLYIKISLKSQTTIFPFHTANGEYSANEIKEGYEILDLEKYNDPVFNVNTITKIVQLLRPYDRDDFKISEVSRIFTSLTKTISDVVNKTLGIYCNFFSYDDEDPIGRNFNSFFLQLAWNLSEENPDVFNKIDPGFWYLEEYCNFIEKKYVVEMWYATNGGYDLRECEDLTLLAYLKGNFQKHLIKEIGQEKSNKIFTSIDFVLENFLCPYIKDIKNIFL